MRHKEQPALIMGRGVWGRVMGSILKTLNMKGPTAHCRHYGRDVGLEPSLKLSQAARDGVGPWAEGHQAL